MTGTGRPIGPIERVATVAGVAVALVVLHRLGQGPLGLPTDRSTAGVAAWAEDRGPATLAVALVRLLGLGLAYQVAVAAAVGLVGRLLHLPRLVRAADLLTLPALRSTTARLAGLGLAATSVLAPQLGAPAGAEPMPPAAATLRLVEPATPTGSGQATIRLVPADEAEPEPADTAADTAAVEGRASAPAPWTVRPGDHLWSIAAATVAEARPATSPSDAAVTSYWRTLVAANPGVADPDLVFPGQRIERPAVP